MSAAPNKEDLRRACLTRRRGLDEAYRAAASRRIALRMIARASRLRWRLVSCYLSFGSEVATDSLVASLLEGGTRVAVPWVDPGGKLMYLSEVKDLSTELIFNRYGIREPKREYLRIMPVDAPEAHIVPGTGFSPEGARLGYGHGYYDRLLREVRGRVPLIGLAFQSQLVSQVPCADHDVPMDLVVTEDTVYRSGRGPSLIPDADLTEEAV